MDGTLRVWSISGKRQIRAIRLDISESGAVLPLDPKTKDLQDSGKLMCVAIDQDDKVACVGCKDGTIRFVDLIAFKQIKMVKIAAEWISDIKWAPNNTKLAIGSHDNAIYIMSYPDLKYNKRSKLKKHSSFITHLDWSRDSSFLHSTCGAYEILFWDTLSMKQMTSGATALRDEKWESWSTVLGWPVQEIFRDNWDGSDVNMVWRSNNNTGKNQDNKYPVLATADDKSKIRLYRWPVLKKNQGCVVGDGHSSHVTSVRFSHDDEYCLSTGGEDQTVMQWSIKHLGEKQPY